MSKTFDNSQIVNQVQSFKGFKNRIINGGFQVKQRGSGGIVNTQDFILDRFQSQTTGSLITAKDLIVLPDSIPLVDNVDPFGDNSGVALWKLDGNADDAGGNYDGQWKDKDGNNIDGNYDTGMFGQGAKFDGNSYIDVGNINIGSTNIPISISGWFKINTINEYKGIISNLDDNGENGNYEISLTDNNKFRISYGVSGNNPVFSTKNFTDINNMHFIYVTYKNNKIYIYIDGDIFEIIENIKSPDMDSSQRDGVLGKRFSGGQYFKGVIDQVRVFNRALTEAEIQKLYLEESKVIKKPYSITLKTTNKPSDYSTQTIKHLVYRFEGQHLYDLIAEGKKATLSFRMTAKKAGKYSVALINKTASSYETLLEVFDYNGGVDELVSATFDLSQFQNEVRNDENLGCELVICGYTEDSNLVGSVGRNDGEKICVSGCVAIDNNDSVSITGLQLEVGEVVTDFEVVPYDVELMRCMRYYEELTDIIATAKMDTITDIDFDHTILTFHPKRIMPSVFYSVSRGTLEGFVITNKTIRIVAYDSQVIIQPPVKIDAEL